MSVMQDNWRTAFSLTALWLLGGCSLPAPQLSEPVSLCLISDPQPSDQNYHLEVTYTTDNFEYTSIRDPVCNLAYYVIEPEVWSAGYREFRSRLKNSPYGPAFQEFELEVVGRFRPTHSGRNIGFAIEDVLRIKEVRQH